MSTNSPDPVDIVSEFFKCFGKKNSCETLAWCFQQYQSHCVGPWVACEIQTLKMRYTFSELPRWRQWKRILLQCRRQRRHQFDPWIGKIPWRRTWQPTPVFLPGKSQGQRILAGYSPQGCKELDMTEASQHAQTDTLNKLKKNHNFKIKFTCFFPPSMVTAVMKLKDAYSLEGKL